MKHVPKPERGRPIQASDIGKLRREAVRGGGLQVGIGLETQGNQQILLGIPPVKTTEPNSIRGRIGTANAPRFGVVHIEDGMDTDQAEPIAKVERPYLSAWKNIGILTQGGGIGDIVWVQRQGKALVTFQFNTVPSRLRGLSGYTLGAARDSYHAEYAASIGPLFLVKDLGDYDGTNHLGVVAINADQGDMIFLINTDETIAAGFFSLTFGDEFLLYEAGELPGVVRVEYA